MDLDVVIAYQDSDINELISTQSGKELRDKIMK